MTQKLSSHAIIRPDSLLVSVAKRNAGTHRPDADAPIVCVRCRERWPCCPRLTAMNVFLFAWLNMGVLDQQARPAPHKAAPVAMRHRVAGEVGTRRAG